MFWTKKQESNFTWNIWKSEPYGKKIEKIEKIMTKKLLCTRIDINRWYGYSKYTCLRNHWVKSFTNWVNCLFFITLSLPLMYVLNHCYTLTKRAHINSCQNEHTKDTSLSTFPEYILDARLSIEISFWNRFWSDFWRFFSSFTWCLYSWKYYMAVKHETITSLFVRKKLIQYKDDRWQMTLLNKGWACQCLFVWHQS